MLSNSKIVLLQAIFILGFGIFHFTLPFILSPNFDATGVLAGLHIAEFVLPGCFVLAFSCIIFYVTKNVYAGILLAFFYCGGIFFHILFIAGFLPPVIIFPSKLVPVLGIVVDGLSVMTIYDYYHRVHLK